MKLTITTQEWPGYEETVCSFQCPLCTFRLLPDLDETYVKETAVSHMKTQHFVTNDLDLVEVPKEN